MIDPVSDGGIGISRPKKNEAIQALDQIAQSPRGFKSDASIVQRRLTLKANVSSVYGKAAAGRSTAL